MSKQMRFYLMPSDTERLLQHLSRRFLFRVLQRETPTMVPVELLTSLVSEGTRYSRQYLLTEATSTNLKLRFYPKLSLWLVETESEVIEFSTCAFDGRILRQGRFYLQTDFLKGGEILPKRPEFIAWGSKVFRHAKRFLLRVAELQAYVGHDAVKFKKSGGIFSQL